MKKIVLLTLATLFIIGLKAEVNKLPDFKEVVQNRTSVIMNKSLNVPEWNDYLNRDSRDMDNYDVKYTKIDLNIDFADEMIYGDNVIQIQTVENDVDEIVLDFTTNLILDDVILNGTSLDFTHQNHQIAIDLENTYPLNSEIEFQIVYHGHPVEPGRYNYGFVFDSHSGEDIAFTLVEPFASRDWWPCKDIPSDKIDVMDINITCPDEYISASNGLLIEEIDNGDGTMTYKWHTEYPISTYLVSLAVTNYVLYSETYSWNGEEMSIDNYVFPEHYELATDLFSYTPQMLDFLSEKYCEYPFLDEKYGHAVYPGNGAMEHQTCTSWGSNLVNSFSTYTVLHELAHQWVGDLITCEDWSHIWLNEGFATYSEVLWSEYLGGDEGYHSHIDQLDLGSMINDKLERDESGNGNYILDIVVYYKGAWVLHMLRGIVGTENMNNILSAYIQTEELQYGTATTEDFKNVCEEVTGTELDWFFDQWFYHYGRPQYEYTYYKSIEENSIMLGMNSFGISGDPFDMFIPVSLNNEDHSVWIEDGINHQTIDWNGGNIQLEMDRQNWVLDNGFEYITPFLHEACRLRDGNISLSWDSFFDIEIDGYFVFRSENGVDFEQITTEPITDLFYIDEDVELDTEYIYRIAVVGDIDGNFISEYSNEETMMAVDFCFDEGILLIDQTNNYPEASPFPSDDDVDTFYETITEDFQITTWDVAEDGFPPLNILANYSTIIYFVDDIMTIPFGPGNTAITNYLNSGGNLIFSGWNNISDAPVEFLENSLGISYVHSNSYPDFISAWSELDYVTLNVDTDKIPMPTWGENLQYVNKFEISGDASSILYYDSSIDDPDWEDEICAFKNNDNVFVLGFPLYFMQQQQSEELMNLMLSEFGEETSSNDVTISAPDIKLSNYPNPFNPETKISFEMSDDKTKNAGILIFNIKGQFVREFEIKKTGDNSKSVIWDGTDNFGKNVSSGIYLYKLKTNYSILTRKMLLMK